MQLLLLSGAIGSGKSSVATRLVTRFEFERIRSGKYLAELAAGTGLDVSRSGLQQLGDRLDVETDYRWVVDDVAGPQIEQSGSSRSYVFDSVRKRQQVSHFRKSFGSSVSLTFLFAEDAVQQARYESRQEQQGHYLDGPSYFEATQHPNEIAARGLRDLADQTIDVQSKSTEEICAAILLFLSGKRD